MLVTILSPHTASGFKKPQGPLFSTTTNYEQAVVACFAALVCGIMAMRRGSKGWLVLVLLAAWGMVVNFLGEL